MLFACVLCLSSFGALFGQGAARDRRHMPLTLDKLPRSCIKFLDRAISNPNPTFAKGEPRNSYLLRTQVTFLGH